MKVFHLAVITILLIIIWFMAGCTPRFHNELYTYRKVLFPGESAIVYARDANGVWITYRIRSHE
jgi:hypothetical protein